MSNSGSFSAFNELLDKATYPMQLEPDIESVEKICNCIDKGIVESSYAIQALCEKMTDENPHTVLFALKVLEKIFYVCGSLAHKVICTEDFMRFLKDIVESTEHKKIRNKILELIQTWAVAFKHLSKYSAPEKLLRNLQADGYVFPDFEKEMDLKSKKKQCENNIAVNLYHEQSKLVNQGALKQFEPYNKDSGIDSDTDMKNREDYFKQSLREYQEQKKNDFKMHQKSLGLPTSSDEENNGNISNKQESQFLYEMQLPESHGLHPELRKVKESKQAIEKQLQECRNSKKEQFKQMPPEENGGSNGILQLRSTANCATCEKYKKKCNHEDTFERSVPRLHPELRKVKQSREVINNSFEEVKKQKSRAFYATTSNDRIDNSSYKSYRNKSSYETKDEQLEKAIKLSETNTQSYNLKKPHTRLGEAEEERMLEEAMRLSLLDSSNVSAEDEELQRAIDLSVADAEEQNFSAFPKLDDDNLTVSYMAELSLNDSYKEEVKLAELYADCDVKDPCVICKEPNFLKYFKPCNHRCICDDCSKQYVLQFCPICRAFYTKIAF